MNREDLIQRSLREMAERYDSDTINRVQDIVFRVMSSIEPSTADTAQSAYKNALARYHSHPVPSAAQLAVMAAVNLQPTCLISIRAMADIVAEVIIKIEGDEEFGRIGQAYDLIGVPRRQRIMRARDSKRRKINYGE